MSIHSPVNGTISGLVASGRTRSPLSDGKTLHQRLVRWLTHRFVARFCARSPQQGNCWTSGTDRQKIKRATNHNYDTNSANYSSSEGRCNWLNSDVNFAIFLRRHSLVSLSERNSDWSCSQTIKIHRLKFRTSPEQVRLPVFENLNFRLPIQRTPIGPHNSPGILHLLGIPAASL